MANFYIATQGYYDATYNFRTETLGIHETTEWVDTPANDRCTLIEMIDGHKNIWEVESDSAGGLAGYLTNNGNITVALAGSAEIYLRCDDLNGTHRFDLYSDASGQIAKIYLDGPNGDIYYTDNGGNHASGNGLAADTWYHISVRWRATGGAAYQGLAEGKFKFFVDSVEYGDYDLINDAGVDKAIIGSNTAGATTIGYFDAIGFTSEGYTIGDNLSLEAHTDITAYFDEATIEEAIRKPLTAKAGFWGQTFKSDDRIIITDTTTDYWNAHPSQNGVIYKGLYNFRDDTDGSVASGWTDSSGASCDTYVIDKYNGHAKVIQMEDYNAAAKAEAHQEFSSTHTYGTVEWSMCITDASETVYATVLHDAATILLKVGISGDKFRYIDSTGYHDVAAAPTPADCQWYRFRVDFECTSGGYESLSQYYWHLYIDGTKYSGSGYSFNNDDIHAYKFYVYTDSAGSNFMVFLDAIDYSWDTTYSIGDLAYLDVTLTAQTIFEGRITASTEHYIQGCDLEALSIELDQNYPGYDANYNPDGYNPNIANYSDEVASEIIEDKLNECSATKSDMIYRGSLSFENDTDTALPYGFLFNSTGLSQCQVLAAGVGNHQYILEIEHLADANDPDAYYYFESQTSGTIEFWIRGTDVTRACHFYCYANDGTIGPDVYINADEFRYYDGAEQSIVAIADDTWYRIRLDFECGAGDYCDLDADTLNCYVYNSAGTELGKIEGGDFRNVVDDVSYIRLNMGQNFAAITYFDAIGFSWDDDYTIGDNNHIYVEKFQVGTATIDFSLNGEYSVSRLLNMIDVLDLYIWYVRGDHKLVYTDGTLDCQVDIAAGDWRDCGGLETIERFNRVVTKGGFSGGARVIGEADDTDTQATYGIMPIIRFFASITSETTLDAIADSILTLQGYVPKIIELDYKNTSIGKLPVGQTITIPATTVFYDHSNGTYVTSGEWLIIKNIYDPRRMNNHLILTNTLFFAYNWQLMEESESLINQA